MSERTKNGILAIAFLAVAFFLFSCLWLENF